MTNLKHVHMNEIGIPTILHMVFPETTLLRGLTKLSNMRGLNLAALLHRHLHRCKFIEGGWASDWVKSHPSLGTPLALFSISHLHI